MEDTKKKLSLEDREKKLVEVELLMIGGIQNASKIAKQLNCSVPTAQSYVNAVRARWRALGGDDLGEMKIDLIERSRELESGYWEAFRSGDNSSAKVGALNGILTVQKFQGWLVGMDITNNPHD